MFSLSDYQYNLPDSHIAQFPAIPADSCKLLLCEKKNKDNMTLVTDTSDRKITVSSTIDGSNTVDGDNNIGNKRTLNDKHISYSFSDYQFSDIHDMLTSRDVLFLNNTRVVKARVPLYNVRVVTQVWREVSLDHGEIFFLQKIDTHTCECLVSLLKRTRPWMKIFVPVQWVSPLWGEWDFTLDEEGNNGDLSHFSDLSMEGVAKNNNDLSVLSDNVVKPATKNNNDLPTSSDNVVKFATKNNNDLPISTALKPIDNEWSDEIVLTITELNERWVIIDIAGATVEEFFSQYGHLPLPPYIQTDEQKEQHYQTVFALQEWSVAAPTAALHFTRSLLEKVEQKWVSVDYVTLHVWLGTFKPVDTPDIRDYHIHAEEIRLSSELFTAIATYKQQGKRIVGVGTTVARTLETLPYVWKLLRDSSLEERNSSGIAISSEASLETIVFREEVIRDISLEQAKEYILNREEVQRFFSWSSPLSSQPIHIVTKIFIYPWFQWRIVDSLITNFHVPWSSLLMLVASAMWYDNMVDAYKYALSHEYRFLSFGDAMWVKQVG